MNNIWVFKWHVWASLLFYIWKKNFGNSTKDEKNTTTTSIKIVNLPKYNSLYSLAQFKTIEAVILVANSKKKEKKPLDKGNNLLFM